MVRQRQSTSCVSVSTACCSSVKLFVPKCVTAVTHLGTKSFTLEQQAVLTETHEVLCRCRTIMVCVRRSDGQSIPIPEKNRELIEAFENK